MAYPKPDIDLDIEPFKRSLNVFKNYRYPLAVARMFKIVAARARDDVRIQTKRQFNLHSEYIPNSVLSTPFTPAQMRASARSVEKYHDINASVFLRPASRPDKSLEFMVPHEKGGRKTSQDGPGVIAVPASGIENYSFRTPRGKTAKRWSPAKLLEEYQRKGPNRKGHKIFSRKKGRSKPDPFLLKGKSGTLMLARRTSKARRPLEFLYSFKKSTSIRPTFHMEDTVHGSVQRNYKPIASRVLRKF